MEHVLTTARGTSLGQRSGGQGRPTLFSFSTLVMMDMISMIGNPANDFTTYDFMNRSNIIETYSLLEPDMCCASDSNREFKIIVYGKSMQMKQDRIIPVFMCQVIETICSSVLTALVISQRDKVIRFQAPKALQAWECRQARVHVTVTLSGQTI
jgi:hypothetical protein